MARRKSPTIRRLRPSRDGSASRLGLHGPPSLVPPPALQFVVGQAVGLQSDAQGGITERTFTWTVTDTLRPVVVTNPGSQTSATNAAVTLQIAATNPEGEELGFAADGLPDGLAINPATGEITGTSPTTAAGTYAVTVGVTSGLSAPVTVTFAWVVSHTDHAPTLEAIPNRTDSPGDPVYIETAAADSDGDEITYSATGLPPRTSTPGKGKPVPTARSCRVSALTCQGKSTCPPLPTRRARSIRMGRPTAKATASSRRCKAESRLSNWDHPGRNVSSGGDGRCLFSEVCVDVREEVIMWPTLFALIVSAAPPVPTPPLFAASTGVGVLFISADADAQGFLHAERDGAKAVRALLPHRSLRRPAWCVGGGYLHVRLFPSFFNDPHLRRLTDLPYLSDLDQVADIISWTDSRATLSTPPLAVVPNEPFARLRSHLDLYDFEPTAYVESTLGRGRAVHAFVLSDAAGLADEPDPADRAAPRWAMRRYETSWSRDPKTREWKAKPWADREPIEVAFREPFRAFALGDDFYFLTDSGCLYRSPRARVGEKRRTLPVWADPKKPIDACVHDDVGGRYFLFCRDLDDARKPIVFEASAKPAPVRYDARHRPPFGGEAFSRVLAFVGILRREKLLRPAQPELEPKP